MSRNINLEYILLQIRRAAIKEELARYPIELPIQDHKLDDSSQKQYGKLIEDLKDTELTIKDMVDIAVQQGITFTMDTISFEYNLHEPEKDIIFLLLHDDLIIKNTFPFFPIRHRGREILAIISPDFESRLHNRRYLEEESSLIKQHLISKISRRSHCSDSSSILDFEYAISESTVKALLSTADRVELLEILNEKTKTKDISYRLCSIRDPNINLNEVILPTGTIAQIKQTIAQVNNHQLIFNEWGFEKTLNTGKGVLILLEGPSGCGKTRLAEACAYELERKLFVVDYTRVINCFVGETEKNIRKIFEEARQAENAVLLFDEADALFNTRIQARDAVDQAFNRTLNILLQELEQFEGIIFFTTNLVESLDPALERRINLRLHLDIPSIQEREQIWKLHIPKEAPISDVVDFVYLATRFPLTGGLIKNAVLNAARRAAYRAQTKQEPKLISLDDFISAAQGEIDSSQGIREYKKQIGFHNTL